MHTTKEHSTYLYLTVRSNIEYYPRAVRRHKENFMAEHKNATLKAIPKNRIPISLKEMTPLSSLALHSYQFLPCSSNYQLLCNGRSYIPSISSTPRSSFSLELLDVYTNPAAIRTIQNLTLVQLQLSPSVKSIRALRCLCITSNLSIQKPNNGGKKTFCAEAHSIPFGR